MLDKQMQGCHSLAKHFSALCGAAVTLVDSRDRAILFTHSDGEAFFCQQCPNHCRLLSTMLYGCNEARRWRGRYTYYCPIGLVFSAVSIPETDRAMIAGPVVMGELQDTMLDLPDYIDKEQVRRLLCCSARQLRHMASVLELAVCGLPYRSDAAYDSNAIPPEEPPWEEVRSQSTPYLLELEKELRQAVARQEETSAREVLNKLLRYVYSPHPDQIGIIRSRAVQLVYMLADIASSGDVSPREAGLYRSVHIPALKRAESLEQIDETLAQMLHLYVDYTFDFNEIKHSDTIFRAMEYIKSNYGRKISLEEIASCVHLSGSHFSDTFHKETGQTLSAYITHVRIEKSKQLLESTQAPICEIGALCGFEDQSYFSRVFRQKTGCSPKKYRDGQQKR